MKKEQLEKDYGLRCGQHIQDAEGIMYLICNDLSGNVSILRLRDSVLFSGDGIYEILEKIGNNGDIHEVQYERKEITNIPPTYDVWFFR